MFHMKNYTETDKIHYWGTHIFLYNLIVLLHVLTISDHLQGDKFKVPLRIIKVDKN